MALAERIAPTGSSIRSTPTTLSRRLIRPGYGLLRATAGAVSSRALDTHSLGLDMFSARLDTDAPAAGYPTKPGRSHSNGRRRR